MLGILPEDFLAVTCLLFKLHENLLGATQAVAVTHPPELWDIHQGAPTCEGLQAPVPKQKCGSVHHISAAQIYTKSCILRKANWTFVVLVFFCSGQKVRMTIKFYSVAKSKYIAIRSVNRGVYFFKFLAKYTYLFMDHV